MPDIGEVGEGFRDPGVVRRLMDVDDGPVALQRYPWMERGGPYFLHRWQGSGVTVAVAPEEDTRRLSAGSPPSRRAERGSSRAAAGRSTSRAGLWQSVLA